RQDSPQVTLVRQPEGRNVPDNQSGSEDFNVAADSYGTSRARPSVAQEAAAQVIGVRSFAPPGEPSGVDREAIGQLPSGLWVATRRSIPARTSGRAGVRPASDRAYNVWPVAKASLVGSGAVWLQPPSARCRASSSPTVGCSASRGLPQRPPRMTLRTLS